MINLIHSNVLNDLHGSIRRWKHAKFQFLIIALSISLLTVLATMLLHIGIVVGVDRPGFVNTDKELVTMVRTNMNNIEKPVKSYQIDKLSKVNTVLGVGKLGLESSRVRVANKLTDEVNIGFLNSSLVELLELPSELNSLENNTNSVLVTPEFWRRYLNEFSLDQKPLIEIFETKNTYIVNGVVPETMSRWSSLEIGIYAHLEELQHFAPFRLTEREKSDPKKLQENITYTRNYLSGAPQYFGFARILPNVEIDELIESYGNIDLDAGEAVEFVEEQHKIVITQGVELNPVAREKILSQWRALLFLSVILLITIISSLVYSQIGQLLHRKKELTIKRAIGATKSDLVKECSLELLPNLFISQLISLGLYIYSFKLMARSETLVRHLNSEALEIDLVMFASVSLLISFLLCLVFSLPFVTAFQRIKLSSSKSESLTSPQIRILIINEFIQKVMLFSSVFLIILTICEIKKISEADTFKLNLVEFRLVSKGYLPLSESLKDGYFDTMFTNRASIMFDSFISPMAMNEGVSVDGETGNFVSVSSLHVAENLFQLANIRLLAGSSEMGREGTVINLHLAQRLAQQLDANDVSTLLGERIVIRGFMNTKTLKIVGISENVPHYGFSSRERPILYKPFSIIPKLYEKGFFALVNQSHAQDFEQFLIEWADKYAGSYSIERKKLVSKQLFNIEYQQNMTRRIALVISILIALLLLFNVFHISRTNLHLEGKRLGVLLAVGERKRSLILKNGAKQIVPFIISLPIVLIGVALGRKFIEHNLQVDTINISSFVIAGMITLSLLSLINIICTKYFLAKPISRLL